MHMIAIWMRLAGFDVPDLHAIEIRADLLDSLDARARQVKTVAEILQTIGHLYHRFEPFQ